jgi:hypothetical protein
VTISNIKADVTGYLIYVRFGADVIKVDNVHIWVFALVGANQMAYKLANTVGYSSERNDVPFISNWFHWQIRIGIPSVIECKRCHQQHGGR